ncbi:MAG: DUF2269 domain-containing protein [Candidatus Eremiobacteraeota bacterium]|nr:DUF2269 domain-containing protein [Candidatus Eremiobacteraeota bacterium]
MYLALKFIHVLAVIVFVGNISIGILWKNIGDLTRDPRIIAHTIKGILLADKIFTIPAVIVLVIAGVGAAQVAHLSILGTGWILWSLILLIVSGIAFGPVGRAQRQMLSVAQAALTSGVMNWEDYAASGKVWTITGLVALILPLIAVALMVTKPPLPAF